VQINFFDPAVIADPLPHYEELKRHGDVVKNDLFGAWMVASHRDALAILKSPATFSSTGIAQMATDRVDAFGGAPTMLFSDPPDHERLRGVVQKAFTPRAVAELEPRVREIVDELVAPLRDGERYDVIEQLAYPLPVIVIAEMLGVSTADRGLFKDWSDALIAGINESAGFEQQERARAAAGELRAYFASEIADRKANPRDDLVTGMVQANSDGTMSDEELLASCVLMLVAGNETTTKFIGNTARFLAENPAARAELAADPSTLPRGFEELVRLVGPAQATMRVARVDVEVAGTKMAEGEMVFVMLGAANRDERVFPDPDRIALDRWPNAHLGFGHGVHFCIGASTARLESRIAFEQLLAAAPEYQLAVEPSELHYAPSFFLRGLESLPIEPLGRPVAV
jgi:cytochrome P450